MQRKITLEIVSALSLSISEWHSRMGAISEREFYLLFSELKSSSQPVQSTFIIAMARKLLELGHLGDGLEDQSREYFINHSKALFDFGVSSYDEPTKAKILTARETEIDFCERFGYQSGAIYEVLRPHKVFQD